MFFLKCILLGYYYLFEKYSLIPRNESLVHFGDEEIPSIYDVAICVTSRLLAISLQAHPDAPLL